MSVIDELTQRNLTYPASNRFSSNLKIIPSMKTMIIGCVDPRVDPAEIFDLAPGEAAVYRNVGGRITPSTLETMGMLRMVAKAGGGELGAGWSLIVLHHTDCGITCLDHTPELAKHFGVEVPALEALEIKDPYLSVAVDVAALKANSKLPGGFTVTGLVYDVNTGLVETVVPAGLLREENTD